jgi:hypothetical protein
MRQRPEDVDISIEIRLLHRAAGIDLGSLVAENLWTRLPEDLLSAGENILFAEAGALGYVLALSAREVLNDDDLVAAGEEAFGHVRADKHGSPGKQDPHLRRPR